MKSSSFAMVLLVLSVVAIQLPAQQSESDRKFFEVTKAEAEKGDAQAQYNLGLCYDLGRGLSENVVEAVKWFRMAGDQGQVNAQLKLGECYYNGRGVAKDVSEALKWFHKAAAQGDAYAEYNIGVFYKNGDGVREDWAEAMKWFRSSAEKGIASSQLMLGLAYYLGKGVPTDYVEAYKWLTLSIAHGEEAGRPSFESLIKLMTREQIAEGQKLAREFKSREVPKSNPNRSRESVLNSTPRSGGSGFFISSDGFLISNAHVVDGANQVRLVTSAGLISAKVLKVDAANDLALLKAEGKFSPLPVAASRGVKLGGTVATVGFPNIGLQGFAPKLAKGEIASLTGAGDDARYFQISVPVQPGNSGGALVDERGNVVGVVSAKLNASAALATSGTLPENVNYAVKSSYLLSFLESVPDVASKLKEPQTKEKKFEDVVNEAEQAAVLVLVY